MQQLRINGGNRLVGEVRASGAKNAALPILAAALLTADDLVLHNVPDLADVRTMLKLLEGMGVKVTRSGTDVTLNAGNVTSTKAPYELVKTMRASVLTLCPLAARFGSAEVSLPGGCAIGARPVDQHIRGLRQLGATVDIDHGYVRATAQRLKGAHIVTDMVTVTGPENLVMAAVLSEGATVIENAAREPEIGDLVRFLRAAGAQIEQNGGEIHIQGDAPLHGATFTILPDRIETATYLCAAAACGGDVTLRRTDGRTLEPVLDVLRASGCEITQSGDTLRLCSDGGLRAPGAIETAPYPGFPTDAQAIVMAALLRARGRTVFTETIFEDRFRHIAELRKFGAAVTFSGQQARLDGVLALHGANVRAEDLRGGAALVIAALSAHGASQIAGVKHILRGYDNLAGKLQILGGDIKYVEIPDEMMYNT